MRSVVVLTASSVCLSFTALPAEIPVRKKTEVIIIHHSATEEGNVEIFRRFHIQVRGWDDIGYHFVISNGKGGKDGEVQIGRKKHLQGAHAKGRNHNSIGVCLVGKNTFTDKQIKALSKLLAKLCIEYHIQPGRKTLLPHHEKCPGAGINISEVIEKVKEQIEQIKKEEAKKKAKEKRDKKRS